MLLAIKIRFCIEVHGNLAKKAGKSGNIYISHVMKRTLFIIRLHCKKASRSKIIKTGELVNFTVLGMVCTM